jgi:hypothetical protein
VTPKLRAIDDLLEVTGQPPTSLLHRLSGVRASPYPHGVTGLLLLVFGIVAGSLLPMQSDALLVRL